MTASLLYVERGVGEGLRNAFGFVGDPRPDMEALGRFVAYRGWGTQRHPTACRGVRGV